MWNMSTIAHTQQIAENTLCSPSLSLLRVQVRGPLPTVLKSKGVENIFIYLFFNCPLGAKTKPELMRAVCR